MSVFVVSRRLILEKYQYDKLNKMMDACNRFYNHGVKHMIECMSALKKDHWYKACLNRYMECKNKLNDTSLTKKETKHLESELKMFSEELSLCREAYGVTKYEIHAFLGRIKTNSLNKMLGINIIQKIGDNLWEAVSDVLFKKGKLLHYRKYGKTMSFEDKRANSGIIPDKKDESLVKICGMQVRIKAIRKSDWYLQAALRNKLKYCRIKRECHGLKYKYFLEYILDGEIPVKHQIGDGVTGIDPGVSTMSYYNDKKADFIVLGDGIEKYEAEIKKWSRIYERRMRVNNPENYNSDGTIKTDSENFHKRWKHTKGMRYAVMKLKSAYQKKRSFLKVSHGTQTNIILHLTQSLIIESMDYKALAKRASDANKKSKASLPESQKPKQKSRFGRSILRRAPSAFITRLETKILNQGGSVSGVNMKTYKASQYNHITRQPVKKSLNERTFLIDNQLVQRDLYSSFLLRFKKDMDTINFDLCDKNFENFINLQKNVVDKIKIIGDTTRNFGIRDFLNNNN